MIKINHLRGTHGYMHGNFLPSTVYRNIDKWYCQLDSIVILIQQLHGSCMQFDKFVQIHSLLLSMEDY